MMKTARVLPLYQSLFWEWSNSDESKKIILDHGDSVTVVYKHIVTEDDLSKRNLPEGSNYPISNSGSAVPDCTVSLGVIYGWSSLAAVVPWLVDFSGRSFCSLGAKIQCSMENPSKLFSLHFYL
ncbi:hypothetical protein [Corynebacterium belfantii]|uniref:hypothetical protein n=1 Tax=Corynebacterium belfantii TaxID=2014537 RepID=UPI00248B3C84|nr:hypothetical protein [Corynebacterium belfantii]